MSTKISTFCDFCGKEKRDVNKWWKVLINGSDNFVLMPAHYQEKLDPGNVKDACGMQCATQGMSRYMSYGNMEDVQVAPKGKTNEQC